MSNEKIPATQLWAWVLTAMSGPLAWIAGRNGWPGVLVTGVVCGLLNWVVLRLNADAGWSKWICALEWLWLPVLTGAMMRIAGLCWESDSAYPAVPLTLILLAALSAWNGAERASRTGGVLFWLLALLYGVILAAGGTGVRLEWLKPHRTEAAEPMLLAVFLLPTLALFVPREQKGNWTGIAAAAVFGTVIALLTAGTLSPQVSASSDDSYYRFSQSLRLFGTGRFESLASVALTMGYFGCASFLMSVGYELAERIRTGWGKPSVICLAILGGAAVLAPIPAEWVAAGSILLLVHLPLLSGITWKIKSQKK